MYIEDIYIGYIYSVLQQIIVLLNYDDASWRLFHI